MKNILIVFCFSLWSVHSFAEVINITGTVSASPCTVDTVRSTLSADLDDTPATTLTVTQGTRQKNLSVILKDCPVSTTKVTARFSGTPYPDDPTKGYANEGTSKQLGVQIRLQSDQVWDSTSVGPGGSSTVNVNTADHSATFNLLARAYTKTGNVMPGTIKSSITVSFDYQ
ncbi:fimbrial protein [Enterobacter sp. R1(2018)]|uniref:fimbrial protein n=1 Tax=Enterobacter sp. R1(2018) TaxID=2447891 RepID=UPI000EB38CA4|nr:fimbrial protein [Enterobacter sp. R1(2018)]RKQ38617.1 type 1 fimbrial protein [Enterobacter sp. R1(2018)]